LIDFLSYECGTEDVFWSLTPRQFGFYIRAAQERVRLKKIDDVTHAWYIGNWCGMGKMPKLEKVLEGFQKPRKKPKTQEQRELEVIAAILNYSDHIPKQEAPE